MFVMRLRDKDIVISSTIMSVDTGLPFSQLNTEKYFGWCYVSETVIPSEIRIAKRSKYSAGVLEGAML